MPWRDWMLVGVLVSSGQPTYLNPIAAKLGIKGEQSIYKSKVVLLKRGV